MSDNNTLNTLQSDSEFSSIQLNITNTLSEKSDSDNTKSDTENDYDSSDSVNISKDNDFFIKSVNNNNKENDRENDRYNENKDIFSEKNLFEIIDTPGIQNKISSKKNNMDDDISKLFRIIKVLNKEVCDLQEIVKKQDKKLKGLCNRIECLEESSKDSDDCCLDDYVTKDQINIALCELEKKLVFSLNKNIDQKIEKYFESFDKVCDKKGLRSNNHIIKDALYHIN